MTWVEPLRDGKGFNDEVQWYWLSYYHVHSGHCHIPYRDEVATALTGISKDSLIKAVKKANRVDRKKGN